MEAAMLYVAIALVLLGLLLGFVSVPTLLEARRTLKMQKRKKYELIEGAEEKNFSSIEALHSTGGVYEKMAKAREELATHSISVILAILLIAAGMTFLLI